MLKRKWMVKNKSADFKAIANEFHIDQVTARLLCNRGVTTSEDIHKYLYGTIEQLYDGRTMKDLCKGVHILKEKMDQEKRIRIIGDYDIDGVTATTILYKGIKACNGNVSAVIPDRVEDGYGLNIRLIEDAYQDGVQVIITCDNGIAAMDAIKRAKELGLIVIVTDHHSIPFELNEEGEKCYKKSVADAIIDPKQEDCAYPMKEICGAFVAYKFVSELLNVCGCQQKKADDLKSELLMYAALGTVGDVMDLTDENRLVVTHGLKLLRKTQSVGMKALIEACHLEQKNISAYHIGYIVGPCINAGGRLKTAELAFSLFQCEEQQEAERIAQELVCLNEERKALTEQFVNRGVQMIEQTELKKDNVFVVYLPDCHESIAGIIAGRIREKYIKPTFVVTKTKHGLKGSGRSIESYQMYEALNKVADCLSKFGGHALAAGFSLEEDRLEEFRVRLNENCTLTQEDFVEKISIDVAMPMDYVTMPLIQEFELLKPFGKGNPAPIFAQKNVELVSLRRIGKERKFVKMKLRTEYQNMFDGILFQPPEVFEEFLIEKFGKETAGCIMDGKQTGAKLSICYVPEINEYAGMQSIQIQVKDYC